jgi:teichuronic acid exporter
MNNFWVIIERVLGHLFSFVISILITRELTPEDFSIFGTAVVFVSITQIFTEGGIGSAIIQSGGLDKKSLSSLFYFNFVLSIIVYVAVLISSPMLSGFYKIPQLLEVLPVVGLNIVISSFCTVPQAILVSKMQFKKMTIASVIAAFCSSCLGLYLVKSGMQYWGLLYQSFSYMLIRTALIFYFSHWRPDFYFNFQKVKKVLIFGKDVVLVSFINQLNLNVFKIMGTTVFSINELGLYSKGSELATFYRTNTVGMFMKVFYAKLSKYNSSPMKFKLEFLYGLRMLCFLFMPVTCMLFFDANDLIFLLLGEKWIGVVPFFQIVMITFLFHPILSMNYQAILAKGRPKIYLLIEVIKFITLLLAVFVFSYLGIYHLIFGAFLLSACISLLLVSYFSENILGVTVLKQVKVVAPVLFYCFILIGIKQLVKYSLPLEHVQSLFLSFFLMSIGTFFMSKLLFRQGIYELINFIKR